MPQATPDFISTISNAERSKILAQCRALSPHDAAEALLNLQPYLDFPGKVYVHLKTDDSTLAVIATLPANADVDYLSAKVGRSIDIDRRRNEYARQCKGEELCWAYYYETAKCKLLERLTHLTLEGRGAMRIPAPCGGCEVRHREYAAEMAVGGLDGVADVLEYWIRRIGEIPIRHPLYN
ncbi:hypothetical protein B0H12DRAFT_1246258 [Mycena haematopus]|nr:hypothetical protein B0H12DRAFT_1246258 [Mycena haematopus]